MSKKTKIQPKKKLTDKELCIELTNLWNNGERGKTNLYELMRTNFRIAKSRCLKFYDIIEQQAASDVLKSQSEANIQGAREAALNGIKTKNERILILQGEVDKCLNELYGGSDVKNFADFGLSRRNIKDRLTVLEKVKLRQTIHQLQSEISKMEGDYAPFKVAPTDPEGNSIPQNAVFKVEIVPPKE